MKISFIMKQRSLSKVAEVHKKKKRSVGFRIIQARIFAKFIKILLSRGRKTLFIKQRMWLKGLAFGSPWRWWENEWVLWRSRPRRELSRQVGKGWRRERRIVNIRALAHRPRGPGAIYSWKTQRKERRVPNEKRKKLPQLFSNSFSAYEFIIP